MTETIEKRWASVGPDFGDPVEVLAYADWLEEQGRTKAADAARYLIIFGRKPWATDGVFTWYILSESEHITDAEDLPKDRLKPNKGWSIWSDWPSEQEAYMAVIRYAEETHDRRT